MSAKNKLQAKRDRKEARELHKDHIKLHPHPVVESEQHQERQFRAAPIERLLRLRRRSVVRAAGLSNTLQRATKEGVSDIFKKPLRRAYAFQCQRVVLSNAEIERRAEVCKTPVRSCVPHKKRGYQNANGN